MENTQILINNYLQLPENLQMEVLHFVEFLSTKINNKLKSKNKQEVELTNDELTDEEKLTLVERYEALELNPTRGIPWQDAKQQLLNKYQQKLMTK